jgi:hypothetical protein
VVAVQRNFQNFTYTDDNAVAWTKKGETGDGREAVDGHAAVAAHPTWIDGARMRTRKITYQDSTTFRTKSVIFYTAAAFAAVALGDVIAFMVEGEAVAVNYAAIVKHGEHQPSRAASRMLADHA